VPAWPPVRLVRADRGFSFNADAYNPVAAPTRRNASPVLFRMFTTTTSPPAP
jgi:hypothetical protein